ncbi:hypothetical protein ACWKT3_16495 [Streptomyces violaceus]
MVIVMNADDAHAIADVADLSVTLRRTRGPRLGVALDLEEGDPATHQGKVYERRVWLIEQAATTSPASQVLGFSVKPGTDWTRKAEASASKDAKVLCRVSWAAEPRTAALLGRPHPAAGPQAPASGPATAKRHLLRHRPVAATREPDGAPLCIQ